MIRRGGKDRAPQRDASVNLLSSWVLEQLLVDRLRRGFLVGLVAMAMLMALGWAAQHLRLYEARQDLRGDQAIEAGLSRQIQDLSMVSDYVEKVNRRAHTVQETMFAEVAFSQVLSGLSDATPEGATIETLSVTLPGRAEETSAASPPDPATDDVSRGILATCPGPDPFATKPVVGCLNLTGSARNRESVGRFVIALGRDRLFVEPFITTTTTSGDQPVTFSGSVGLAPAAFSGRYDRLAALVAALEQR